MKTTELTSASVALSIGLGMGLGMGLVPGCAAAQGPVQIYGRLNVAIENVRNSSDGKGLETSATRESNYRSVLGMRGSEALGEGMQAIYQIEGTLAPDTGAGSIAARDTRLGLEGKYGTLFAGNWVTPYNAATSGLDPFYPTTAGYMSIMGNGSASNNDNVSDTSSFDRRQQNSVHYITPVLHGVSLRLAHGLNEESPAGGAKPSLTSAAAVYERGPLYFAVAHELHRAYQGMGRDDRGTKLAAAYRFGETRIAAVAEQLRYASASGTLARRSYYLSATHQFGPHGIRVGLARAADGEGGSVQRIGFIQRGDDTGALHYTLGYDYILSKRTSAYMYYSVLRNEKNAVYDFAINSLGAGPGATLKASAVGLRHAF